MKLPPVKWLKKQIIIAEIERILEDIFERDQCVHITGFPMLPEFIVQRLKDKGIVLNTSEVRYYFQYLQNYIIECSEIKVGKSKNGRLWVIKRLRKED